jgi:signal peptidase I
VTAILQAVSKPDKRRWVRNILIAIGVVVVVGASSLVMFTFRTQPSGSMLPTLDIGERIVVNKLRQDAAYGEVIVFRFPENRDQEFVKRVIARPGDTLEVLSGRPIVNGQLVPSCLVGKVEQPPAKGWVMLEYLKGRAYLVMYDQQPNDKACTNDADCSGGLTCRGQLCGRLQGPYTAKSNEVWVMGDNRNNSHDSRSWRGGLGAGVPLDDVVGAVRTEDPALLPAFSPAQRAAAAACLDKLRK